MDSKSVVQYITTILKGVDTTEAFGYTFFFYNPGRQLPAEKRFPFATLITQDNEHDRVSNLTRPGAFRLNIGVKRQTYQALLGEPPKLGAAGIIEGNHDFTLLDTILPHPHYAPQSWICVVSPSDQTFEIKIRPLLNEAHAMAVKRFEQMQPRAE
jgi:hypothetical protein